MLSPPCKDLPMNDQIQQLLHFIYGEQAAEIQPRLSSLISFYQHRLSHLPIKAHCDEGDAILITYGDMVQADGRPPLASLAQFLAETVRGMIRGVHILPFYPYSSDDGFSVIDYKTVNPEWGSWEDVAEIGRWFRLMFDAVVNHISVESSWFQAFLQDRRPYTDYFRVVADDVDVTAVFRPRTHPLLTPFRTPSGSKNVWTTFSADQVDLNFANPDVLLAVLEVLLFYVEKGAEFIRLDAIAYIWKEIGTDCLHRPQTHALVKLMRAVLDDVVPNVCLITETNVPHEENIAYFGNGRDEAQMVYNFPLPPLTLHAFHTGNAQILSQWANSLALPSNEVTYFNFLASHDGIGVQPARGLLTETAVAEMAVRIEAVGGHVSYKTNSDGSQSPYELNCNFLDALGDPDKLDEPISVTADRFMAAQAIMLVLKGVPGIYFHSLFGSRNWHEGVILTGQRRSINRQKLDADLLKAELEDAQSLRHYIFEKYKKLLQIRQSEPAFHPQGEQNVLFVHEAVFSVERWAVNGRESIRCLQNVSGQSCHIQLKASGTLKELITERTFQASNGQLELEIEPYGIYWLKSVG